MYPYSCICISRYILFCNLLGRILELSRCTGKTNMYLGIYNMAFQYMNLSICISKYTFPSISGASLDIYSSPAVYKIRLEKKKKVCLLFCRTWTQPIAENKCSIPARPCLE